MSGPFGLPGVSCVAPAMSSWIACSIRWASSKVHQTQTSIVLSRKIDRRSVMGKTKRLRKTQTP